MDTVMEKSNAPISKTGIPGIQGQMGRKTARKERLRQIAVRAKGIERSTQEPYAAYMIMNDAHNV
jgi:hypothetical protein